MVLSEKVLEIWSNVCDSVQKEICEYKFNTYNDVKKALIRTAGIILIHSCRTADSNMGKEHWCGRMTDDGKILGRNTLGNIWMAIRDSFVEKNME